MPSGFFFSGTVSTLLAFGPELGVEVAGLDDADGDEPDDPPDVPLVSAVKLNPAGTFTT